MRAELIADEMASAVRLLGGDGPAKSQNHRAARETKLSVTVIERLRWKKLKRVPADIADVVREAVARHNQESLNRAKHELHLAQIEAAALKRRLEQIDPDFDGAFPLVDRRASAGNRRGSDFQG